MNRLQRYIFWEVSKTSAVAVGVFVFVLLAGNALKDVAEQLFAGRLTLQAFGSLLLLLLPYVVSYALPLGLLTGVLMAIGRLSGHREITAMRASGVSLFSIGAPVFFIALLGTVFAVTTHGFYGPAARQHYREELARYVRENPLSFLREQTFIDEFPGYVLYIGDRTGTQLRDFWIWELDEQDRATRMLRADHGRLFYQREAGALILVLLDGRGEARPSPDPEALAEAELLEVYFDEFPIQLSIEGMLNRAGVRRSLKRLTLPQLVNEWHSAPSTVSAEELPQRRMSIQVHFQENLALGYAVMALSMIGFPLAIRTGRRETYANMGLAMVLAILYYTLAISVSWLERVPQARPDLLVWLPNLLFQGLGVWLLSRMDRV